MSTGKVVLGALAGIAVGAVLGILFAPEKGSTTRKQIMDKGDDYVDGLKSKYKDLSDAVKDQLKSSKKEVKKLAQKGKETLDDVKEEVKKETNHVMSASASKQLQS